MIESASSSCLATAITAIAVEMASTSTCATMTASNSADACRNSTGDDVASASTKNGESGIRCQNTISPTAICASTSCTRVKDIAPENDANRSPMLGTRSDVRSSHPMHMSRITMARGGNCGELLFPTRTNPFHFACSARPALHENVCLRMRAKRKPIHGDNPQSRTMPKAH